MARHMHGLLPVPSSPALMLDELARLERELARTTAPAARRLLAIERRRVVVALALASSGEAA